MNLYKLLKLKNFANVSEVKKAYRNLAKIYHTDVAGERSKTYFQSIVNAYETLSDPIKKSKYDAELKDSQTQEGASYVNFDLNDDNSYYGSVPTSITIECTISDMLDTSKRVKYFNSIFQMPGYYTPSCMYQTETGSVVVQFDVQNYVTKEGHTLIPNYNGMCVTLYPEEVEFDNKPVRLKVYGNPYSSVYDPTPPHAFPLTTNVYPDYVDEENKVLTFHNIGIPFQQPITGRIITSALLVDYKEPE